jgi:hypothetical protein
VADALAPSAGEGDRSRLDRVDLHFRYSFRALMDLVLGNSCGEKPRRIRSATRSASCSSALHIGDVCEGLGTRRSTGPRYGGRARVVAASARSVEWNRSSISRR